MAQKSEGREVRLRNRVKTFLEQVQDSTGKKVIKACAELAAEFPNAHLAKVRTVLYLFSLLYQARKPFCEPLFAFHVASPFGGVCVF